MLSEAIDDIEGGGHSARAAIVVGRPGWNVGIVGIVAGRLAERYGKPVVVVGFDEAHEGAAGRGSVRAPQGYQLHTALERSQAALTRFGGHQAAAGLEVALGRLSEFREDFASAFEAGRCFEAPAHGLSDTLGDAVRLDADDEPHRVLGDFQSLEPCGEGNRVPVIAVEGDVVSAREVRGGHLKLELELRRGRRLAAFGIELGDQATGLDGRVTLVGSLRPDRWRGGDAVEVRLDRILRD
jgi:single-stranded-DNA-specific exonuclease